MPMAYPLRWPGGPEACKAEALDVVKSLIHTQVGEQNVAAVIIEPIQGEGGFIVPPDGFLAGLAEFCQEHGIVFIADEIQSGFCRTGDWFAVRARGRRPRPGHHRQGHRRRPAARRGDRARRDHGRGPPRRPRRHLRRQPGRLRRRARRDRDDGDAGPRGQGAPHRRDHAPPAAQARRGPPGDRRRARPRRDDRHRADQAGHPGPGPGVHRRGRRVLPQARAWSCSPAGRSATCCASCRRSSSARTSSRRASASWRTPSRRCNPARNSIKTVSPNGRVVHAVRSEFRLTVAAFRGCGDQ